MSRDKKLINILYVLFILGNFALDIHLIVLDLFALLLGLAAINYLQWDSKRELLYYLVLLFSVMDFAFNLPLGHYNIYYLHIALFLLTLIMLWEVWQKRKVLQLRRLAENKYLLFLAVFLAYMLVSFLWVPSKKASLKYLIDYVIMICFALAVYRFNPTLGKLKQTLKYLFMCMIPVLVLGLFEIAAIRMPIRNIFSDEGWYTNPQAPFYLKTIPSVFFYNPNNFGTYLILVMSFVLAAVAYTRRKGLRWGFVAIQVAALLNVIFSTSRTAYITMLLTLIGFVIFFIATREREKRQRVIVVAVITLVIFYALSFVPQFDVYYGKFNNTALLNKLSLHAEYHPTPTFGLGDEGSTSERYTIIVDVIEGVIFHGHPQGFGIAGTPIYVAAQGNTFGIVNIHSLWFEILGDFGIGIFLYFLYIYLALLWDLLKLYKESNKRRPYGFLGYTALSLFAALGGFILTSFAPSSVINFSNMWLMLSLAILVVNKQKRLLAEDTRDIFAE